MRYQHGNLFRDTSMEVVIGGTSMEVDVEGTSMEVGLEVWSWQLI